MTERVYSLLLVDDEEASRLLLARRLEQAGYHITPAEGGRQALRLMHVERFDLVLLDMYMPEMDGLTTLDAIKSDEALKHVPVIVLTAANSRDYVVHCLSLGAADYLIKPVNPVELRNRVQRCLTSRAPRFEPTLRVETATRSARVLAVDDDEPSLQLLQRRLEQLGFRALAAPGGRAALAHLQHEPVDAVLLDIQMADMDGFAVLQAIRADSAWQALPVLMLSADGSQETLEQCQQLGANDYLVKPYQPADLQIRLAAALELKRARPGDDDPI